MPMITRGFSLTNFIIATSALCFQVTVLYPWHKELDEGFEELKREHYRILKEEEKNRLDELQGIRAELAALRAQQQQQLRK